MGIVDRILASERTSNRSSCAVVAYKDGVVGSDDEGIGFLGFLGLDILAEVGGVVALTGDEGGECYDKAATYEK